MRSGRGSGAGCADISMRQYPEMHSLHSSFFLCEPFWHRPVLSPCSQITLEPDFQCRNAPRLLTGILKPGPAGNENYWTNSGMEIVEDELL